MKTSTHVLVLLLCLLSMPAAQLDADVEPLIVAQDHAWPPFAFLDAQGNPRGALVELWHEIGQRLERPVTFLLVDWPESIELVRRNEAQVHGGLLRSPERAEFFEFSAGLMPLEAFAFVASDAGIANLAEFIRAEVGVVTGSYEAEFMREHYPQAVLREFRNNDAMVRAAVRGNIVAFVGDYPVAMYLLDQHATPADFRALAMLYARTLHAGVPSGDTRLLEEIDAVLATLDDETRRRLTSRWLRSEKIEVVPEWFLSALAGGALLLALLLLAAYSLMLRRQRTLLAQEVEARTAEAREREAQFRTLADTAAAGIFVLQGEHFVLVNAAMADLLGYSQKELLGMPFHQLVHPGDRALVESRARVRQRGEELPSPYEMRVVTRDGETRWVELSAGRISFDGQPSSVGTLFDITERKRMEERVRHMALHDALTDLPNRVLFSDLAGHALETARREQTRLALLMLDLDHFKPVNDSLGHAVGDLLLQQVAQRVRESVRASDVAGRIGGDEFVVCLQHIEGEQDAVAVANKILERLRQPFIVEGRSLQILASIGIAIYPEHGLEMVELLRNADYAMYAAKQAQRNTVRVFREDMLLDEG